MSPMNDAKTADSEETKQEQRVSLSPSSDKARVDRNKHVRIDEGIKRGPKGKRLSVPRRRDPETGLVQAIPPNLDPREVLERYLTEQTTSQIAKSYGLTRKSLVAWLREVCPEEWRRVQIVRALDRRESADEGLDTADHPLSLARERERLKSAQWTLERLDHATWGEKQQVEVGHKLSIDSSLGMLASELVDRIKGETIESTSHRLPESKEGGDAPSLEEEPGG